MYEDFYGLHDKPFALSPDPRFYYASKGHRRAMAYLEYGVQQGDGFIVISGEVGAGKTTLVRSLLNGVAHRSLAAAQLVSTQLGANDLLRSVCLAFGVEPVPAEKADQLRGLERHLQRLRGRGQRALLIVDEAQNLDEQAIEELRMLSNFEDTQGPLLQSFLLGQPELRRILRSERMLQLRQRVIATFHLGPMDEEDTRRYVEHRLGQAGWQGDPEITECAWSPIYSHTGGVPRRINTLLDRLMLMGFLEELHTFSAEEVQLVVDEMAADLGGQPEGSGAVAEDGDTARGREVAAGSDPPGEVAGMDERLRRVERFLGFNYRVVERVIGVQREETERLSQRLDRIERYLVVSYRIHRRLERLLRAEAPEAGEAKASASTDPGPGERSSSRWFRRRG